MKRTKYSFILLILPLFLMAQKTTAIYDSGGELIPEQAAYDVTFYDLKMQIFPEERRIEANLTVEATLKAPLQWLVLDLDTLLQVERIENPDGSILLSYERKGGTLWIDLGTSKVAGSTIRARITYAGSPLQAPIRKGGWSNGLHWSTTAAGAPWLGVVSVLNGADFWWPCKDHPSDKPDSMALHITVPEGLVVAANGQLREVYTLKPYTSTYYWFVSTPINNYSVAINVAPYITIAGEYENLNGDKTSMYFWVLPEHYQQGLKLFPQMKNHLRFYEEILGPYPFRVDKYGVAETPYLGMENQSIISYGHNFTNNDYGFDGLHFHELAHEWWANLVTAPDWRDWWLHESFASYLEALYAERLQGDDAYHNYIRSFRKNILNRLPVAPQERQTSRQIYNIDIYYKGAWMLHSLRYLIGKDRLLQIMRRTTYPDPEMENIRDGRQCHFVTTDQFIDIAERISGQELDWFFEIYLRQPELPRLSVRQTDRQIQVCWETPNDLPFPMPVEIRRANGKIQTLNMDQPCNTLRLKAGEVVEFDPQQWILREF